MTELDPVCYYSHVVPGLCDPFPKRLTSPRCILMIPRTILSNFLVYLSVFGFDGWHHSDMNDTGLDPGVVWLELKNDQD